MTIYVNNNKNNNNNFQHALHLSHLAEDSANFGFDIVDCKPINTLELEIFDLYATKLNALRLAVDAALTVLRGCCCFLLLFW